MQYSFLLVLSGGSIPWKSRSMRFCFKEEGEAQRWRQILSCSISSSSEISSPLSGSQEVDFEDHVWQTFLHINGISIYTESEQALLNDEDPAVMSSVSIRAPPKACLRALLISGSEGTKIGGNIAFSDTVELLRRIDSHTAIVRICWKIPSLLGYIFASREAILLRTWRKDEDGSLVVVYQPVADTQYAETKGLGSFLGCPVRANIQAAGFTIAPLRPEYVPNDDERWQESLVTLVVKADVGGFLKKSGLFSKLFPTFSKQLRMTLLQPLLFSLIMLRDRLEQGRFVVMPSMFSRDEDQEEIIDQDVRQPYYQTHGVEFHEDMSKEETKAGPEISIFGRKGCCNKIFWSCPGVGGLKIRGKTYLQDKIKIPAKPTVFDLHSSDLIDSDELLWHVGKSLPSVQLCDAPYAFILNLLFPNNPLQSLVTVWTCPIDPTEHTVDEILRQWNEEDMDGSLRAFFTNFKEWVYGDKPSDDARRSTKFKLIPRVAKGSWVVRQSVGTTPVLLGQKLNSKYFRGRTARGCSYFEMDVDITSNTVANNVTKLVVNSITSLVVDLSPLIEGQSLDHLPERLIGSVRYDHLDLRTAATWDEEKQTIVPRIS